MSGIKPIGSEKLQGMDKIKRIMEIARFNENIPNSINETAKSEYKIDLADGNTYEIVRERQGYIIKGTINESDSEYIEPIQERNYYRSYSQALKRLNLMAKEINDLYENKEGISLIGEQKKKFILKRNKKKQEPTGGEIPTPPSQPTPITEPPAPVDAGMGGDMPPAPVDAGIGGEMPPAPVDAGVEGEMPPAPVDAGIGGEMPPAPVDADMGDEMPPAPVDSEMGGEMPPSDDTESEMPPSDDEDLSDMGGMGDEEKPKTRKVSDFKRIQILVGKLAQKIRTYEESDDLSPKDIKYIINSILSAIDVDVLDEDDIEQIISKLEGTEEDEDETTSSDEGDELPSDNEESPEEMGETYKNYGEAFQDYLGSAYTKAMSDNLYEDDEYGIDDTDDEFQNFYEKRKEEDMSLRRTLRQRPTNSHYHLKHGTFGESKIDKILSSYYTISENEIKEKYSKLVENKFQYNTLKKFLKENSNSTFMGKSIKGNLIFKSNGNEYKITKSGSIL